MNRFSCPEPLPTGRADIVASFGWFTGLRPPLLVTLVLRSRLVKDGGLQKLAIVLAIVEQPKNKLCVLAFVLLANARVYAALHDRVRLGVDDLELRVMAICSGGGAGGGGGGEGVRGDRC